MVGFMIGGSRNETDRVAAPRRITSRRPPVKVNIAA
jgi:hypothetical protein